MFLIIVQCISNVLLSFWAVCAMFGAVEPHLNQLFQYIILGKKKEEEVQNLVQTILHAEFGLCLGPGTFDLELSVAWDREDMVPPQIKLIKLTNYI